MYATYVAPYAWPHVPSAYKNVPDLSGPPPRSLTHPRVGSDDSDGEGADPAVLAAQLERCAGYLRAACAENARLREAVDRCERMAQEHARSRAFRNQATELRESDRVNAALRRALRARGASGDDIRRAVKEEVWGGVERVLGTSREALMLEVDRLNAALGGKDRADARAGRRRAAKKRGKGTPRADSDSAREDERPAAPRAGGTQRVNSAALTGVHAESAAAGEEAAAAARAEAEAALRAQLAAEAEAERKRRLEAEEAALAEAAAATAEAQTRHMEAVRAAEEAARETEDARRDRADLTARLEREREAASAQRAELERRLAATQAELQREREAAAASDATKLTAELARLRAAAAFMARALQKRMRSAGEEAGAGTHEALAAAAAEAFVTGEAASLRRGAERVATAGDGGEGPFGDSGTLTPASRAESVSGSDTGGTMGDALEASRGARGALEEALDALNAQAIGTAETEMFAASKRPHATARAEVSGAPIRTPPPVGETLSHTEQLERAAVSASDSFTPSLVAGAAGEAPRASSLAPVAPPAAAQRAAPQDAAAVANSSPEGSPTGCCVSKCCVPQKRPARKA